MHSLALSTVACILCICWRVGSAVPVATSLIGPIFSQHVETPEGDFHYTASDVAGTHGAVKQQTAVGKDVLGGHSIRHSSQATHIDPYSGSTAVKHNEHEFHINPYYGQAAVHTNNAEGSLNHHIGAAAFKQEVHDSKLAPGHSSVADSASTAEVSPLGNAASQDVHVETADVIPAGLAKTAHTAHRSYAEGPLIGGVKKASSTTKKSFDGHGYGNHHYNTQAASQAYDPYGHASSNEAGYNLNKAYDLRSNLGATNELEYSRHASQDPYGNYGQVTQSKQSSHGGPIAVPAYAPAVYKAPAVIPPTIAYGGPAVVPQQVAYAHGGPAVVPQQVAYAHGGPAVVPQSVAYSQGAYVEPAYAQGGYVEQAYAQGGYVEPAYAQGGYVEPAYAQGASYAEPGYGPVQYYYA